MRWSQFDALRAFDPWRELEELERVFSRMRPAKTAEFPEVNVWVGADDAIVTAEVPGVEPASMDISVAGTTLTIRGSREPEKAGEGVSYHRRERWHGSFSRSLDLPFNIETEKVRAGFRNGVLTITLPRAESERPRKIEIISE